MTAIEHLEEALEQARRDLHEVREECKYLTRKVISLERENTTLETILACVTRGFEA